MNSVLLGDVVSITGGGTPSRDVPAYYGGSIPWITVKDFGERLFLDGAQETITEAGLENSATRLIPAGNVILVTRMNVGAVAINRVPVAINQDLKALLCKTDLDPLYLLFFMLSKRDQLSAGATGATVKGITIEDVVSLELPLPPLAQQRRIAAILRAANDERRRRRYTQALSDGLLGEVFVRMFGDPATNPMGWECARIAELGNVQTGNTPSRDKPENYGDYIEWIKSDNIVDGQMRLSPSKERLSSTGFQQCRYVDSGASLITCIAGSLDSIGDVALADRRVAFNQQINAVTPFDDVEPYFLYGLLLVSKSIIQDNATESMKRIITKSKFENVLLFKPPIEAQRPFAMIVAEYEQVRRQQQESARQADHLFETLLHRAFAGEL